MDQLAQCRLGMVHLAEQEDWEMLLPHANEHKLDHGLKRLTALCLETETGDANALDDILLINHHIEKVCEEKIKRTKAAARRSLEQKLEGVAKDIGKVSTMIEDAKVQKSHLHKEEREIRTRLRQLHGGGEGEGRDGSEASDTPALITPTLPLQTVDHSDHEEEEREQRPRKRARRADSEASTLISPSSPAYDPTSPTYTPFSPIYTGTSPPRYDGFGGAQKVHDDPLYYYPWREVGGDMQRRES